MPGTGVPIPGFGNKGIVELTEGLDREVVKPGQIGSSSPAIVIRDVVVLGAALSAGTAPASKTNVPGYIRGFDVRTGKRLWTFRTIPHAGEFGNETWEKDSWEYTGNTGAWAPLSGDEELGYVYIPVEMPTGDFYGAHRLGDNLFADSLVCLDARTGKRIWHFQIVHHDLWDWDLSSPPILADITVGGKKIKAVAQVTKQAFTFVFDRVTGQPVWPIVERPVPQSNVPGERTSPTQPFPTKPAPFDRQGITTADLIDFTPELRAEAIKIAAQYRTGPLYLPPSRARCRRQIGIVDSAQSYRRRQLAGRRAGSRNRHTLRVLGYQPRQPGAYGGRSQAFRHGLCSRQRTSRRPVSLPIPPAACRRFSDGEGRRASEYRTPGAALDQAALGPDHRHRPEHRRPRVDDRQRRCSGRRQESSRAEGHRSQPCGQAGAISVIGDEDAALRRGRFRPVQRRPRSRR